MYLLIQDHLKLVLIAFAISVPISWYCLHSWLNEYAHRIQISVWVFILAGFFAILLTVVVLSTTLFRVVLTKPADGLRNE